MSGSYFQMAQKEENKSESREMEKAWQHEGLGTAAGVCGQPESGVIAEGL